jgi:hypothetical protein
VQYHPEAAPGPHDAAGEFGAFCALMERGRAQSGGGTSRGCAPCPGVRTCARCWSSGPGRS